MDALRSLERVAIYGDKLYFLALIPLPIQRLAVDKIMETLRN
jgi:hypothetical protein